MVQHEVTMIYKDPDDDSRVYQCACGAEFTVDKGGDYSCPEERDNESMD